VTDRVVLVTTDMPFDDEAWQRFEGFAAPDRIVKVDRKDRRAFEAALQDAEIAVLGAEIDDTVLAAPRLKWVHVNISGMNDSARKC